jgi:putative colanic acid biosynthesis UDP-glucose lipid carrier transferase
MQMRIGFNGRPFRICKFRTMATLEDGPVVRQASRNDERVTRVGRVLRRLSLDELPQLMNVLRGEMSLVGPRPHALAHDHKYKKLIACYVMRQKMKPGITGLAQIRGCRGETPNVDMMKRRVENDLQYIDSWSLWLDVRILALTLPHVLTSPQAY